VARPAHSDDDAAALRGLIREARSRRPLEPGEQDRLLRQAADGDQGSEDRLVAAYLPTVVRLAAARADEGLSVPDLVQEGSIGFVEAMRTYDAGGAMDFAAFAEARISARLTSAIEAEAAAVRDARLLVAAAEDYDRTEALLRRELHRAPTEGEIAEKLEWTVERTRYVAEVVADARRRHDEELLAFIDPEEIDLDGEADDGDAIDPALN
jgi:DNA-directed RNA polymerase sigma subunit (sigma70/sigma32)